MAQHPTDMRMGVNGMCGQVGKVGLDPSNGDVYIFVGKSCTTMKLLHWELLLSAKTFFLTSSLRHPKIFIKEFGDFLMPCHQHCLSVYLLVQR